ARSLPSDRLRPAYFFINGDVYFIQQARANKRNNILDNCDKWA
ncbi:hypothetical protein M8C21_023346, partial [Ambrosia artemisiifolia]